MARVLFKNCLKGLFLGMFAALSFFYLYTQTLSKPATLKIVVGEQPNSPVQLLATFVDDSNPLVPRYGYSLTNKTDKKVVAFTIQREAGLSDGGTNLGYHVLHIPARNNLIKPNESRQGELGGISFPEPVKSITISIDFVEFADGTRWGANNSKTAEMLDGTRIGGHLAIKEFGDILASKGIEGLSQALESDDLVQPPDKTKPDVWLNGFRTGVNVTRLRLKAAKQKGGREEAEKALKKGFDSFDGREDQ